MEAIKFSTSCTRLLADVYTPVAIYLRLRDKFRDSILLESADYHVGENSFSIIGINAVAGIEITNADNAEQKFPGVPAKKISLKDKKVTDILSDFMKRFAPEACPEPTGSKAQGLFGYISYDGVQLFENILFTEKKAQENEIPWMRYRLYQYVIVVNHFKSEMHVFENHFSGIESQLDVLLSRIRSRDVPVYPFSTTDDMMSGMVDDAYRNMVKEGVAACLRGDVFQIVLSRQFSQKYKGDDFNVYRALRSVNPSPYLFYFDYGDYKLAGSSPEAQVIVQDGFIKMHPIAGTVLRTGDDDKDKQLATTLENDPKELAEHVMLVDLARNDLSRIAKKVTVTKNKEVQYFSHVIHLVSEVVAETSPLENPYSILAATFPAGTLSGAPKYKAMQLIDSLEPSVRGFYGGVIGFVGFDGSVNHAIMIRSFLSKNNALFLQAGAGVVAGSTPEEELQEVENKLAALKTAIKLAADISA